MEEVNAHQKDGVLIQPSAQPGDIRFKDVNGDGSITDDDRVYCGSPFPDFTFSINGNITYKNWDLNIFLQWSYGNDILNANRLEFENAHSKRNKNMFASYTERWTPDNPVTDGYPRLIDAYGEHLQDQYGNYLDNLQPLSSTTITNCSRLEDVSYLKISTISLTYQLPDKWAAAMKMRDFNISFLMNNLFTFTNYSGMDPETPGAVYPQSRSFSFNLSFSF